MKKLFIISIVILINNFAFGKTKEVTFAGGCFWCMEPPFEKLEGVSTVISGYTGGKLKSPTYEQVSSGKSGHLEVVQVTYDDEKISLERLLEVFWMNINPTDGGGQFVDRGEQYSTAIFYNEESQKKLALESKKYLSDKKVFKKEIVTRILKLEKFYPAEEYHQDFYKKSFVTKTKYKYYRNASGRDEFLNKVWNDKYLDFARFKGIYIKRSEEELKRSLSSLQYSVTQEDATERPFKNKYWNNKEAGIYVDLVSGEPLFSSKDKYVSKTGWPSFTRPINKKYIIEKEDNKLFTSRVEVRSKFGDSHLGHVFEDGPAPLGLRYCINSASLRFISKEDLVKEGYKEFVSLF